MENTVLSLQSTIFVLLASLLAASVTGYILLPVLLEKMDVKKLYYRSITKFTVGMLFFVIFIFTLNHL